MECTIWSGDYSVEFYREKVVKARKIHKCDECQSEIEPGEKYQNIFSVSEGYPGTHKTCWSCMELRDELQNELESGEYIEFGGLGCAYASYLRDKFPECYQ